MEAHLANENSPRKQIIFDYMERKGNRAHSISELEIIRKCYRKWSGSQISIKLSSSNFDMAKRTRWVYYYIYKDLVLKAT